MMAGDMHVEPAAPVLAGAFPEAERVGEVLRRRGLRVAVAESCTGGLLGAALTAVPGSSDYVVGGVIAYADEAKAVLLGVLEGLLRQHGAVSAEVAGAMACGARERLGASVGVGITGVAGPGAQGSSKPAGLIYVAACGPDGAVDVRRLDGDHGREGNRAQAVHAALRLVAEAAGATAEELW
jgi:PncC family amidohydrolase